MSDLKWTYRNEGIEMMPKDAVILMTYGISANVGSSQNITSSVIFCFLTRYKQKLWSLNFILCVTTHKCVNR
jgi:hypothetical protein